MSSFDASPSFSRQVPQGDNLPREVCDRCGFIHYQNPKLVAGSVVSRNGRILLCRRAIDPRKGYWTLPAGYMELNETTQEAAEREAREEANAQIEINALLAVYSIKRLSQVQIIYRAKLLNEDIVAGEESLEVALFPVDDLPWNDLAFPSVHWALHQHHQVAGSQQFSPFTNPDGQSGDQLPDMPGGL